MKMRTSAAPTLQTKTVLNPSPPGVVHLFRFRGVTKSGVGNRSQVVALPVQ